MAQHTILVILGIAGLVSAQEQTLRLPLTAFNAGEMSPLMEGRPDYPKYSQGLRICENLLPLTQGPVCRRPGTKYIATTKDSGVVELKGFEYSTEDVYVLEFGDEYMRIYRNGGQVLDANDDPYEITTVFDSSELSSIQVAQAGDTMYIVDGNDEPQKLTRTAHTSWTLEDVNLSTGPFLLRNTEDIRITPSATTGTITLTSTEPIFDGNHVDSIWKLYQNRADTTLTGILDANESTSTLSVSGDWTATTHGTWTGVVTLERSIDAGATWTALKTCPSTLDNNMETSGKEEDEDSIYRMTMTDYAAGTCTIAISMTNYLDYGVVKITEYTDPCMVTGAVLNDLVSTDSTRLWCEGYWSPYRGWPRTIAFHEQRLWFGGSTGYPQNLWAGKTAESEGDYEDFTEGTDDDSAMILTIPGGNPIRWLHSQSYLMVATSGTVGRIGELTSSITPTNRAYRVQTEVGSEQIPPIGIGDVLLYVQRGGRKVRQYVYSMDVDQFIAPDITILAEHITEGGVIGMELQSNPQPIVWATRGDGEAVTMTYIKEEEVIACARQVTDGTIESIVVVPGSEEDEVWWAVAREIGGSTVRYIEQVQPHAWGTDQNDCWFVDSGLAFDGGAAQTVVDVTKASPCVVTVSTWPTDGDGTNLADGDQVQFDSVMDDLDGNVYTVASADSSLKTFALKDETGAVDINSVGFGDFTAGGSVQRVENTFGGLDHLEGETVSLWCDGHVVATAEVADGEIVLEEWYNRVLAGLPYTSVFETMPLLVQTQAGLRQWSNKRPISIAVDFYQTLGPEIGTGENMLMPAVKEDSLSDATPELYTGWKDVMNLKGGYTRKPVVRIEQDDPAPMTIRQIDVELRVSQ